MTWSTTPEATKHRRSSSALLPRRCCFASTTLGAAALTITSSMVRESWKRWARSVPDESFSMSFTPSQCARLQFCY